MYFFVISDPAQSTGLAEIFRLEGSIFQYEKKLTKLWVILSSYMIMNSVTNYVYD